MLRRKLPWRKRKQPVTRQSPSFHSPLSCACGYGVLPSNRASSSECSSDSHIKRAMLTRYSLQLPTRHLGSKIQTLQRSSLPRPKESRAHTHTKALHRITRPLAFCLRPPRHILLQPTAKPRTIHRARRKLRIPHRTIAIVPQDPRRFRYFTSNTVFADAEIHTLQDLDLPRRSVQL
jgi:hypothetical protein